MDPPTRRHPCAVTIVAIAGTWRFSAEAPFLATPLPGRQGRHYDIGMPLDFIEYRGRILTNILTSKESSAEQILSSSRISQQGLQPISVLPKFRRGRTIAPPQFRNSDPRRDIA